MKKLFTLSLIVVSGLAHASFELALVPDAASKKVFRFDPESGASLGSFGDGRLSGALGIGLDQAQNAAIVLESSGIVSRWNYNTGAFLGSFRVRSDATFLNRNSDGNLLVIGGDKNVSLYSPSGALIRNFVSTGSYALTSATAIGNDLWVSSRSSPTGTPELERFVYSTGTRVGSYFWYLDRMVAESASVAFNVYEAGGGGFMYVENNTFSGGPSLGAYGFPITDLSLPTGAAFGHNRQAYFVGKVRSNPSTGAIGVYDYNAGVYRGYFGNGVLKDPRGISVVVAPEPASMVGIALGVAALCRRRRSKR